MWKYLPVLNAIIQVLFTIGLGIATGALGLFKSTDPFVPLSIRYVYHIGLPCLVIKGIGINTDFYSDTFLWKYIAAFLILRFLALLVSFAAVFYSNWRNKEVSSSIGDVAVRWLALTWISTVIMGIPISTAVFGSPAEGQRFGLLAGISSFIFQLPLQLVFLECYAADQNVNERTQSARSSMTDAECETIENGEACNDQGQVEKGSGQFEVKKSTSSSCAIISTSTPWWSLAGAQYLLKPDAWKTVILRLCKNPVLVGILTGFVISLSTLGPKYLKPQSDDFIEGLGWISSTLSWVAATVSPVSLFAMGLWMQSRGMGQLFAFHQVELVFYMFSKVVVCPLVILGLAKMLDLPDKAGRAGVLIASLPISLASFSLGKQFSIGEAMLSANVTVGTVMMLPAVLIWNAILDAFDLFPIPIK